MLDEAGWTARDADGYRTKDGARLSVSVIFPAPGLTDNRDQLISAIAAELHQNIGLQLDLQLVTNGEYTAKAKENAWGAYPASWPGSDTSLIFRLVGPGSVLYGNSPHGGVDPQIIALNDQSAATPDVKKRTELYKQLQKIAMDQGYILPLYNPTYQIAATRKVHGLSFETRIDSPSSAYDVWTES
ncbi:periplasmic substrate-binding domain-containing protein [Saccharopolyspora pogona]|uniref:hypothetical protein n=1 Tax=Saccharopolyspora pogona TaxID=333966 RepID=UPI0021DF4F9A|nr:hypothetical protein [Saccharopolyspora pogona]